MKAIRLCTARGAAALAILTGAPAAAQAGADMVRHTYDAAGRPTGTIHPDPDGSGPLPIRATRNVYDAAGQLYSVEQLTLSALPAENVPAANWSMLEKGSVQWFTYDSQGRKISETVTSSGIIRSSTSFSYERDGQVKCTAVRMNLAALAETSDACVPTSVDPKFGPDRITRNHYDAAGQLVRVERGIGTALRQDEATYQYNLNGQRTSLIDARGYRAEMTYDGLGRQKRWIFPSKSAVGVADQADYEEYGYDADGNRISLRKRDGAVLGFEYDALNRMTVKVVPERTGLAATHSRDVYYSYDLRGLQTGARFGSVTGEGVVNEYDGFGRLKSSTITMDGVARKLAYHFDASGNRDELTYPDQVKMSFLYDRADRMTGVREGAIGSATVLANIGYYAMGQLASVVRGGGDSTSYQYAWGLQRPELIRDTFTAGTGGVDSTFAYNPASQIATRSRSNDLYVWTRARSMNRAYNPNGQNQYAHVGAAPFQNDANGNLSDDGQSIYVYDVENRLVSATPKAGAPVTAPKGQLRYDPLGRLYETSGGALGTTRYLYDGDELVAEYDGATGALRHRYVHGAAVDDPLIWYEGADLTRRRAYHADHQGSIVAIAGAAGETLAVQTYDPWGVPGASLSGRFAYTGQIFIPELAMYHYKARLYSPTLGRFMQVDPIGYEGGQNLYAYVANDPVVLRDPTGLCPICLAPLAVPAAAEGIALAAAVAGAAVLIVQSQRDYEPLQVTVTADYATAPSRSDGIVLHRGVDSAHPGYAEALLGVATPRGGNASPVDHTLGNTDSIYTSWTSDPYMAERFATKESGSGVVLTKEFSEGEFMPAPAQEFMGENEYLVPGVVAGADVSRVPYK